MFLLNFFCLLPLPVFCLRNTIPLARMERNRVFNNLCQPLRCVIIACRRQHKQWHQQQQRQQRHFVAAHVRCAREPCVTGQRWSPSRRSWQADCGPRTRVEHTLERVCCCAVEHRPRPGRCWWRAICLRREQRPDRVVGTNGASATVGPSAGAARVSCVAGAVLITYHHYTHFRSLPSVPRQSNGVHLCHLEACVI